MRSIWQSIKKKTVAWKCSPHGVCLLGPRSHDIKQSLCSFAWRPWGSGLCAYSRFFLTHNYNLIRAKNECLKNLIKLLDPLFSLFMVDWPQNPHPSLVCFCFYTKKKHNTSVWRAIVLILWSHKPHEQLKCALAEILQVSGNVQERWTALYLKEIMKDIAFVYILQCHSVSRHALWMVRIYLGWDHFISKYHWNNNWNCVLWINRYQT